MEIWKKMWVGVFFWTQCSVIHCHTTDYSLLLIYYTVYNKVIQHCSLPLSYSITNNEARFGLARSFFDANNNVFIGLVVGLYRRRLIYISQTQSIPLRVLVRCEIKANRIRLIFLVHVWGYFTVVAKSDSASLVHCWCFYVFWVHIFFFL